MTAQRDEFEKIAEAIVVSSYRDNELEEAKALENNIASALRQLSEKKDDEIRWLGKAIDLRNETIDAQAGLSDYARALKMMNSEISKFQAKLKSKEELMVKMAEVLKDGLEYSKLRQNLHMMEVFNKIIADYENHRKGV